MPRKQKLPTGVSIVTDRRTDPPTWRVRLGTKFTGGKPDRRRFAAYQDAIDWVNERIEEKRNVTGILLKQTSELGLTPQQAADAVTALHHLQGRATLTKAALLWLDHASRVKTPTVATVIEMLADEKFHAGKTQTHYRDLENSLLRLFRDCKNAPIGTIDDTMLARCLAKTQTSLADRRNKRRDALILFRFAMRRRFVTSNPVEAISKPSVPVKEVEILSPTQTAKILWHAHENNPEMLPYFAICIFAGLRNQEILPMTWEKINLKEKEISVSAAYAKIRRARQVEIHTTLLTWLKPLEADPSSFVCPLRPDKTAPDKFDLQARRRAITTALQIDPWPANCLRHGYGSYHYALNKNAALTASQMGNSEQTVKAHYTRPVRKSVCDTFWRLTPDQAEAYATAPPSDDRIFEEPEPEPDLPHGYYAHIDGLGPEEGKIRK